MSTEDKPEDKPQKEKQLEFSGVRFTASEIQRIEIVRNGNSIVIERCEEPKRMGFK